MILLPNYLTFTILRNEGSKAVSDHKDFVILRNEGSQSVSDHKKLFNRDSSLRSE